MFDSLYLLNITILKYLSNVVILFMHGYEITVLVLEQEAFLVVSAGIMSEHFRFEEPFTSSRLPNIWLLVFVCETNKLVTTTISIRAHA